MSRPSQQPVPLATTAPPKRYRVTYQGRTVFEGTKHELFEANPTWWKYAKEIVEPEEEEEDDRIYNTRPPTSTRRYDLVGQGTPRIVARPNQRINVPPRAHRGQETEDIPQAKPKRQRRGLRAHPLLYLGIGMITMLALWVLLQTALSWWQVHSDDSTYGRPRTFQLDGVFGHNDSAANPTHIIIVNLNRHVIVIELPGGDSSKARIYTVLTLYGDGQDLTPVTAKVEDVNGDGKPDVVLFIQDQRVALLNDNGQFRSQKPGEHITMPK